jgi:hypothetical protein
LSSYAFDMQTVANVRVTCGAIWPHRFWRI